MCIAVAIIRFPSRRPALRALARAKRVLGKTILLAIAVSVPIAIFSGFPAKASELTVAAGCDLPKPRGGGRAFYVDPVHGDMANDGSAERPWRTFAEVVSQKNGLISTRNFTDYAKGSRAFQAVNPAGPVHPGDELVLMSGDHGDVELRRYMNEGFIRVVAGAGQVPTIKSLHITTASHWLFEGLKFQSGRPEKDIWGGLVQVGDNDYFGPSDNVIFSGNSFSTQDDVSQWRDVDWVEKPYGTAFSTSSRCTALYNNHFYNVRNAINIEGNDNVVSENLIENFGNDGIELLASNLLIRNNTIRYGHHTPAEPLHPDGIQGWTLHDVTNKNIVIDANKVVDTNQSKDNEMQGITIFDGRWDGITVSNNVVITNHWHGISFGGVAHVKIVNNTVLPSKGPQRMTWINIGPSKDNRPSSDVVIRNNIAGQIVAAGINVDVDHNVVLHRISRNPSPITDPLAGNVAVTRNAENVSLDSLTTNFDMVAQTYDLRLPPNSPAREAGCEEGAPETDADGRNRKKPIDIGAYSR